MMREKKIERDKKKANSDILPFFMPMAGCPYRCIYCDQQATSGEAEPVSPERVGQTIAALKGEGPFEVAYYGGTFSALDRAVQEQYLAVLQPFIKEGTVSSVRVSTRPDAIDAFRLDFLKERRVETVELGVQSFDPAVLLASGRDYSPQAAEAACSLVLAQGLKLGVQLMTGLPGDSYAKSLFSMRRALALKCRMIRIYPTLVLQNTPLAALWREGRYRPQTLAEAVDCCRDMLALAQQAGVPVIRMGLNPSAGLAGSVLDGPYHPAFGHYVLSALKQKQLAMLLAGEDIEDKEIVLSAPPRELPLLAGQDRQNRIWLENKYRTRAAFRADSSLPEGAVALDRQEGAPKTLKREQFLAAYCQTLGDH